MEQIQIFNNPAFGDIRVTGTSDQPLFCLADVAKCLGYIRPADAVTSHCKGVVILQTPTNGGIQQIKFGSEGDVYRLVMSSKMANAEKFQDWVCDEVLPAIRRHGAYMTRETIEKAITSPDFLIQLATQLKEEKQKRLDVENKNKLLEGINEVQYPKAVFADAVMASSSSCLIGELAKILTQNGVKIGQNRLFTWLRQNGYLGCRGERYNIPNQQYIENGIFEIKKSVHFENGSLKTTTTTKCTAKGQLYFINKFINSSKKYAN